MARVAAGAFGFSTLVELYVDPKIPKPAAAHRNRRSETTDSLEPVADRVGGWLARHVVANPALDQVGLVGVAEEDEGGTIVEGLAVTGNLPSFLQHSADRRRVLGHGPSVNRQRE
jgi:hypothetical protein